jgi:hypothetical protein
MPINCTTCGAPVPHTFDALGCIQCGRACCPECSVQLESAAYCARCAESLIAQLPGR